MARVFKKKNFLKALPGMVFLAFGFLLPLLWWPTKRVGLALLLYCPGLLVVAYATCYLSAIQRSELSFFLKAAVVLSGVFAAFLLYVFLYRAVCL